MSLIFFLGVDGFPSVEEAKATTTAAANNQQEIQSTDNNQFVLTTNLPSTLQMTTVITTEGVEVETMATTTTTLIEISDSTTVTAQVSDINEETSSTTTSTHNEILPTMLLTTMMPESTSTTSSSTFQVEATEMNVFETNQKPPEVNVGQTISPIQPDTTTPTTTTTPQTLNDDDKNTEKVEDTTELIPTNTATDENGIKQIISTEQNNTELKTESPSVEKTEQKSKPSETDNEESIKMEPAEEKIGPTEAQIRPTMSVIANTASSTNKNNNNNDKKSVPNVYFSPPQSTPAITIMKIDGPVTQPGNFLHENCHHHHEANTDYNGHWQSIESMTSENENWTPLASLKPSSPVVLLETYYCTEPGLFQHPSLANCNQFLQCDWTGQLPFVLSCGVDTYWDDIRKQCGWSCVRS